MALVLKEVLGEAASESESDEVVVVAADHQLPCNVEVLYLVVVPLDDQVFDHVERRRVDTSQVVVVPLDHEVFDRGSHLEAVVVPVDLEVFYRVTNSLVLIVLIDHVGVGLVGGSWLMGLWSLRGVVVMLGTSVHGSRVKGRLLEDRI